MSSIDLVKAVKTIICFIFYTLPCSKHCMFHVKNHQRTSIFYNFYHDVETHTCKINPIDPVL